MPLAIIDPLTSWTFWTWVGVAIHFVIQGAIAFRVVIQQRAPGETLAWIMVVFVFPIVGPLLYLMMGEYWLGRRRERRFVELYPPIRRWLATLPERRLVDWSRMDPDFEQIAQLGEQTIGVPAVGGNAVELIDQWFDVFEKIIQDVDAARSTCHFEFYIWEAGGIADKVVDALVRARQRGVTCRVLVDAMGSRSFLRSAMAARLRDGVQVREALPGGLWRLSLVRFDLRQHRKVIVIDGKIGYTGSLNMADPRLFKRDVGVGQWIDAMIRIEGPAVEALAISFLSDWYLEGDDNLALLQASGDARPQPARGDCTVQIMPTGPGLARNAVEHVLLTSVDGARDEIVLTTPYFVPSESFSMALVAAARRGVKVILVVPARIDSALVRYASGAFKGELLEAGVRIAAFGDGLLHTKSVPVAGRFSLFGSVNLGPRSFRLNFEILAALFDSGFTGRLRKLQQHYIDRSMLLDLDAYQRRPRTRQTAESFARLLGPLL
ncbi:MAG TPA: cardiolipin synthase [Lacipirellulaceae bacterium]|nr:cardiolipin synthase [Lacipirellulaceae bacterium]